MPSLALDLVSHEVHIEARKERTRQTSRRMYVQEPHILTDHLDMLLHDTRYAWIRSHISKLEFTRVRVSPRKLPDWRPLVSQWPRLRTVNIQVVRLSGKFPLNIANEYCSGIARFSKGMVTSIIRELMEKSYVSELVIRVLQPDDLRYALEQNCSTYEASVRYTGIYQDESSTELFHVVRILIHWWLRDAC